MKLSKIAAAVIYPISLWAADDPRPLDTRVLVGNSLKFNVETVMSQAAEGGEPIPATPSVTLELYEGNFYKLSIITVAAQGYAFPHFLPGEPVDHSPPSSRAIAGFGYYSTESDTLRFNAHYRNGLHPPSAWVLNPEEVRV